MPVLQTGFGSGDKIRAPSPHEQNADNEVRHTKSTNGKGYAVVEDNGTAEYQKSDKAADNSSGNNRCNRDRGMSVNLYIY